jgi:hypothetical protein
VRHPVRGNQKMRVRQPGSNCHRAQGTSITLPIKPQAAFYLGFSGRATKFARRHAAQHSFQRAWIGLVEIKLDSFRRGRGARGAPSYRDGQKSPAWATRSDRASGNKRRPLFGQIALPGYNPPTG